MVETVRSKLGTGASNSEELQPQNNEILQDMIMEKVRGRLQEVQQSILKDVDKKLNYMVEEVLDEIRKEVSVNSEFRQLFNYEESENNNGYKRKPTKDGKLHEKEFIPRNSMLTDLLEVKHIRTIYHIFLVIMSLLFLNTLTHDLFASGRINISIRPIIKGFGNLHYGLLIWAGMQLSTFFVYPVFKLWANGRVMFPKGLKTTFDYCCILAYIAYIIFFGYAVTKGTLIFNLAPASSLAVLMEMTRFLMKTHAFIRSNVPKALLPKGKKTSDDKPGFYVPAFQKFLYFLFIPTLVYRDHYPRTKCIRWNFVVKCVLEVIGIIFYVSFIFERYLIPIFQDFGAAQITSATFVLQIFGCMMPGMLMFLCAFYLLLHSWMNAFAEILTFADRMFYQDWWTTTSYPDYYRKWNIVVHDWLYTYIYKDCYEHVFTKSKTLAMLSVFTVSSFVHEYIIAFTFHFFYPVMLVMFQGFGVLLVFVTKKNTSKLGNILLWWSLITGNGVMFTLYNQEFNARHNCPVGDSWSDYFIPVSWNCHGLV